ncbi:MAG: class I SAM-dependent rRNA methyltransferase [Bdellovibrionales bacterium]|nr:class I SAM-dependent rRNA methyltransferase [Bdellovibrionales bacterium]
MSPLFFKITLSRNLRKYILQGQPWVYKDAIVLPKKNLAGLCQVHDKKGFIAWAFYDKDSPLALRILSTEKNIPDEAFFKNQFLKSLASRKNINTNFTNAFRLINGEGDYFPGLVCDIYNHTAIIQFDGSGPELFWKKERRFNFNWIFDFTSAESIVIKSRHIKNNTGMFFLGDEKKDFTKIIIKENNLNFLVNVLDGQKTGFFLDQRDNRNYVEGLSSGKSVLNLFSYTGGFSVYAGRGGSKKVCSVDLSSPAINYAQKNWELNNLPNNVHNTLSEDILKWLEKKPDNLWDIVIVDPPSMAKSKDQKQIATKKYINLFSAAIKFLKPGGDLILSSCSSHINFSDFQEIINQAVSVNRKKAQVFRLSSQGSDHPYLQSMPESRYLKFVHLKLSL